MTPVSNHLRSAACLALGCGLLLGCSSKKQPPPPEHPPMPLETLKVHRIDAALGKADPAAPYWRGVIEGIATLTAQPMVNPRPEATNTERVFVKAVTDGKLVAFRFRWSDTEVSEAGRLGEFSDALAVQFPIKVDPLPPVFMGARDQPVHIFHWRAQYQRDAEKGKPTMASLYPNMSIDMYPMEFKDQPFAHADDREQFSPGQAAGNPQSYDKTGVDEIVAEGFSTSSVQVGSAGNSARGEWNNGEWTLVIVRPLAVEGGSTLASGAENYVAFAAWQGGKQEVASRKSLTMNWIPMAVQ